MDWLILGIQPTKDKKAITDAYRQKLRQTNPEDKPEEFKALRTAYEQALALADQEETEPVRDESPVGLWMAEIQRLYDDFAARIDPAKWQATMDSAVCVGLDTRPAAEEALLKFLLEHFYLPRKVWQVLDETFRFTQRAEELYETWPREFVDHAILSGVRFDPSLDYTLFTPGISGPDCDAYIRLYYQANQTPPQELEPLLTQLEALPEQHPYGKALRYRFYFATGREQEGKEGFRQLAAAYPDNAVLCVAWAELCLEMGDADAAEPIISHILELRPDHTAARASYARCLAAKGQYQEAKECAYELIRVSAEDTALAGQLVEQLKSWNEQLIVQREKTYAETPEDINNIIELAWCYAQNDRIDDAIALAATIDPDYEDAYAYHNLMGKLYHNTGKFAQALPHMQQVETVLRNMTDDGTAETHKRLKRLPEMLQVQGNCLLQLGRTAEAKEKFQQALDIAPEDTEVLLMMSRVLFSAEDYTQCAQTLRRLLRLSPGTWVAELLLSLCLYYMRQDREAFEAINRALSIQEYDLGLYVVKMQILLRNEAFEDVHAILDFLQQTGAPGDIALDFIRAELTDLEKQDKKAALKQYQALQQRVEAGEDMLWCPELYHRLAVLRSSQLNMTREADRNTLMALIEKGLSYGKQNPELLECKAWVLKNADQPEQAAAMYLELLEKAPESEPLLRGLADLYYEDLAHHAQDALTYYEKLLETRKTTELYFFAATCKRYLGDIEGARLYYLKEQEMDPEDIDAYRGLAFLLELQKKDEEALAMIEQALAIMEQYNRSYDWMVEHKAKLLRRLGRYEEALSFAADAADRFGYQDTYQLQFDICCQFGLWERAAQVVAQWRQARFGDPDMLAAAGRLQLLQGKMFKATLAMGIAKRKLSYRQVQDFRLQLADLECNHARQIQIWSLRVKRNPQDDYALTNLAQAYWHAGKKEAARGAAAKALALQDAILSQNLTDAPIFRSRRSLMLAILGRTEEAKEELAKTRAMPLCDFCEYGSCKDADIYEAAIEEILGNTEDAKKLYTAGREKWPDDLDFASGLARLKKRRK